MVKRRTLAPSPARNRDPSARELPRDPLLVAMPPGARSIMVLEARTFATMPIGRMLVACLDAKGNTPNLEKDGVGLDDVTRLALIDAEGENGLLLLSGSFARADASKMGQVGDPFTYGNHGRIFPPRIVQPAGETAGEMPRAKGHDRYIGTWNDELIFMGSSVDGMQATIDRLEGRVFAEPPLDPDKAYGELYGRVTGDIAQRLLPRAVGDKLRQAGLSFDFHLDASKDALLVVDASGDPNTARDIGQTLAAALTARRVQAIASGENRLARLLDLYSVRLEPNGFQLEAAFPMDFVREALGDCAKDAASTTAGAAGSGGAH